MRSVVNPSVGALDQNSESFAYFWPLQHPSILKGKPAHSEDLQFLPLEKSHIAHLALPAQS